MVSRRALLAVLTVALLVGVPGVARASVSQPAAPAIPWNALPAVIGVLALAALMPRGRRTLRRAWHVVRPRRRSGAGPDAGTDGPRDGAG